MSLRAQLRNLWKREGSGWQRGKGDWDGFLNLRLNVCLLYIYLEWLAGGKGGGKGRERGSRGGGCGGGADKFWFVASRLSAVSRVTDSHLSPSCLLCPTPDHAGEAIAGEYVWGRYDLLLLPPSFPYG